MEEKKRRCGTSLTRCIQSIERERGLFLRDIPGGSFVQIETHDGTYFVAPIDAEKGSVAIQGNGSFFQNSTLCTVSGSTWGGSMIRLRWIGVGMYLEVRNRHDGAVITTSMIKKIMVYDDPAIEEILKRTAAERASRNQTPM